MPCYVFTVNDLSRRPLNVLSQYFVLFFQTPSGWLSWHSHVTESSQGQKLKRLRPSGCESSFLATDVSPSQPEARHPLAFDRAACTPNTLAFTGFSMISPHMNVSSIERGMPLTLRPWQLLQTFGPELMIGYSSSSRWHAVAKRCQTS